MLATMLNVDPACGLVNVVNVDVWSWVVRRKCKNLAILSDFKRFWTIFLDDLGRFGTISRLALPSPGARPSLGG